MDLTAATVALAMAEWMDQNKTPFPGGYQIQPNDPTPANDLMQLSWDWDQDPHTVDAPAADASKTPGNQTGLILDYYIAAQLAGIGFLVKNGVALADFSAAINADPHLTLSSLYVSSPGNMYWDLVSASQQVATQLAPTNRKMQCDFFGVFGVAY